MILIKTSATLYPEKIFPVGSVKICEKPKFTQRQCQLKVKVDLKTFKIQFHIVKITELMLRKLGGTIDEILLPLKDIFEIKVHIVL